MSKLLNNLITNIYSPLGGKFAYLITLKGRMVRELNIEFALVFVQKLHN